MLDIASNHSKIHSPLVRYGMAVACVVLGIMARIALTPEIGPTALPFIFFFPAVAAAAWLGGLGPGVLAILLSALAANWFFIPPVYAWSVVTGYDLMSVGAFLLSSLIIVAAIQAMHRTRKQLLNAQKEIVKSRDLLATTVASIGDAVIMTDASGNITFLNPEAERLTGWRKEEANGQPLPKVFQIINEHTRHAADNPVEKVIQSRKVTGLANHTLLVSKSGKEIPIDDSAAPIQEADGPLSGVVLVFRDVTEQRQAFEANARFAAVVAHSGDVILTKNLKGIIQTWNASAERLFGYKAEEIIGKHVTTLFPPERLNEEDHILDRLRHGEPVERLITVRVAKDGKRIPVSLSVSPLKDAEGNLIGASKIVRDISDLVAAREALAFEKELLATTLASIGDGVIVTDKAGKNYFSQCRSRTPDQMAECRGKWTPAQRGVSHHQ